MLGHRFLGRTRTNQAQARGVQTQTARPEAGVEAKGLLLP